MPDAAPIRLAVWSDYVCPFCYLELPVLERLQAEFGERLVVDWRAFELRPEPNPTLDPDAPYLHRVWSQSVYPMAEQRGMVLRLPPVQPRSRKALEAAEFARERGRFDATHRALFKAFFEDGRDLGDLDVLTGIGGSAGLDTGELRAALESGRYTGKVLADQDLAHRIGLSGVPALLIIAGGKALHVSGAQPYEVVRAAVEQAASDAGAGS